MKQLQGVVTAPITPMNSDLSIDYDGLRILTDHLVRAGIHGLTPCAVTAEAETLDLEEHRRVLKTVVEAAAGRVPVYCGIGRSSIIETRRLLSYAESVGADGLFVITPYCNGYTLAEVLAYYRDLASRTKLPVMIYNCPGYSGINIPPASAAELAREENIVSNKEGRQDQLHETVIATADQMAVFTARDSYLLPSLVVGSAGVVSFAANAAPELLVALWDAARSQDFELARKLHERVTNLVNVLVSRSYPLMIKAAVAMCELPSGPARRIEGGLQPIEREALRAALVEARSND